MERSWKTNIDFQGLSSKLFSQPFRTYLHFRIKLREILSTRNKYVNGQGSLGMGPGSFWGPDVLSNPCDSEKWFADQQMLQGWRWKPLVLDTWYVLQRFSDFATPQNDWDLLWRRGLRERRELGAILVCFPICSQVQGF